MVPVASWNWLRSPRLGAWTRLGVELVRRLAQLWLVRLPHLLDPWAPGLADAVADVAHLAPWRGAAGFAPLLGLALVRSRRCCGPPCRTSTPSPSRSWR